MKSAKKLDCVRKNRRFNVSTRTELQFCGMADVLSDYYILIRPTNGGDSPFDIRSSKMITMTADVFLAVYKNMILKEGSKPPVKMESACTQTTTIAPESEEQSNTETKQVCKRCERMSRDSADEKLLSPTGHQQPGCMLSPANDEEVRSMFEKLSPDIRNISLRCEHNGKNPLKMEPIKYVEDHIHVLQYLVHKADGSLAALKYLAKKFIWYLIRLFEEFTENPDRPEEVIRHHQSVLANVRKMKRWSFRDAMDKAAKESEPRENAAKSPNPSQYIRPLTHIPINRQETETRRLDEAKYRERLPAAPLAGDRVNLRVGRHGHVTDKPIVKHRCERGRTASSDTQSEGEIRADARSDDEYAVMGRGHKRTSVDRSHSPPPTKKPTMHQNPRDPRLAARARTEQENRPFDFQRRPERDVSGRQGRGEERKFTRGICCHFNYRHGCKWGSKCHYQHVCRVCKSPSHGQSSCEEKTAGYDASV